MLPASSTQSLRLHPTMAQPQEQQEARLDALREQLVAQALDDVLHGAADNDSDRADLQPLRQAAQVRSGPRPPPPPQPLLPVAACPSSCCRPVTAPPSPYRQVTAALQQLELGPSTSTSAPPAAAAASATPDSDPAAEDAALFAGAPGGRLGVAAADLLAEVLSSEAARRQALAAAGPALEAELARRCRLVAAAAGYDATDFAGLPDHIRQLLAARSQGAQVREERGTGAGIAAGSMRLRQRCAPASQRQPTAASPHGPASHLRPAGGRVAQGGAAGAAGDRPAAARGGAAGAAAGAARSHGAEGGRPPHRAAGWLVSSGWWPPCCVGGLLVACTPPYHDRKLHHASPHPSATGGR